MRSRCVFALYTSYLCGVEWIHALKDAISYLVAFLHFKRSYLFLMFIDNKVKNELTHYKQWLNNYFTFIVFLYNFLYREIQ